MNKFFLLLSLFTLPLAGCGSVTDSHLNTSPAAPVTDKIQVVASFYPLAFMAEQIAGNKGMVTNLAGAVGVHAYRPTPQDLVKLNEADLVIFQGAGLEPWTEGVVPNLQEKGVATLEVSHHLELAKNEGHDDHDSADYEEDEEAGHDEHEHGEFDPHAWLDPVLAQAMVAEIAEALMAVDPANEAFYKANAKALQDRFSQLDEAFAAGLSQCANEEVIASHGAYGYLARRYGFDVHSIAGLSTQDVPSAKVLAALKAEAEAEPGLTHILVEENGIQAFAKTLASETGLQMLPVNPLGRGTLDPTKDFFAVMEMNLQNFKIALNCQ